MVTGKNAFASLFLSDILCCQKLLNGAIPVPGPIMMTGVEWSSGKWKPLALLTSKLQDVL